MDLIKLANVVVQYYYYNPAQIVNLSTSIDKDSTSLVSLLLLVFLALLTRIVLLACLGTGTFNSVAPSTRPSFQAFSQSIQHSAKQPTIVPSFTPSVIPSISPSNVPSRAPSFAPSDTPFSSQALLLPMHHPVLLQALLHLTHHPVLQALLLLTHHRVLL